MVRMYIPPDGLDDPARWADRVDDLHSLSLHEAFPVPIPKREHSGGSTMEELDPTNLGHNHPSNWRYGKTEWEESGWLKRLPFLPWFQCVSKDTLDKFFEVVATKAKQWDDAGVGDDLRSRGFLTTDIIFYPLLHSFVVDNKVRGLFPFNWLPSLTLTAFPLCGLPPNCNFLWFQERHRLYNRLQYHCMREQVKQQDFSNEANTDRHRAGDMQLTATHLLQLRKQLVSTFEDGSLTATRLRALTSETGFRMDFPFVMFNRLPSISRARYANVSL